MALIKVLIKSKESCDKLKLDDRFVDLETKRDKKGKWVSSEGVVEINEEGLDTLKELGKKAGFTVSKTK
jgi:hypothetical protein